MSERIYFGKLKEAAEPPNLIEVQLNSYVEFLQKDVTPSKRQDVGLQAVFREVFPIGLAATLLSAATIMYGQTAKDDIKQAGRDARSAAKNTGRATAKTAKKTKVKVKRATNKAAANVERKTRDH